MTICNALDEFHSSRAYHSGRLLAIFQHIQDLADAKVGATYVSRYYGAAVASPCLTLPRIWSLAQHRLRQIKSGRVRADIDALLVRCHDAIHGGLPVRLSIVQQGEFQLGFFHQKPGLPYLDERRRLPTKKGEPVKSSGEQFIADVLFQQGIEYFYEAPFTLAGYDRPVKPDFTIYNADKSRTLLIEYAGMIGDDEYDRRWKRKQTQYRLTDGLRVIEECVIDGLIDRYTLAVLNPKDLQSRQGTRKRLEQAVALVCGDADTPW